MSIDRSNDPHDAVQGVDVVDYEGDSLSVQGRFGPGRDGAEFSAVPANSAYRASVNVPLGWLVDLEVYLGRLVEFQDGVLGAQIPDAFTFMDTDRDYLSVASRSHLPTGGAYFSVAGRATNVVTVSASVEDLRRVHEKVSMVVSEQLEWGSGAAASGAPVPVTNTVDVDALRFIVRSLDGDLELPSDSGSGGYRFFEEAVQEIQMVLVDEGAEAFLEDPRGYSADYGVGSPLDLLRPVEMLRIAAQIDATEFHGVVDREGVEDLTDMVRRTLMAVYEDVFSAVDAALGNGDLKWDGHRLAVAK